MKFRNVIKNINSFSFYAFSFSLFTSISLSSLYHIFITLSSPFIIFKKRDRLSKSSILLILFCFSIVLSTLVSGESLGNILKIKYFLIPILSISGLQLFLTSNSERKINLCLKTLLITSSIATLSGLYAYYFNFNPIRMKAAAMEGRASGLYGMVMSYGHSISYLCTILLGLATKRVLIKNKKLNTLLKVALTINLAGLVFSFTRGAWLSFLVSIPFLFLSPDNNKIFLKATFFTMFLGFALYQVPSIKNTFTDRVRSNNMRIAFFKSAIEGFKEKPLLGLGYRRYEAHSKRLKKKAQLPFSNQSGHAHNNYIEHLASLGLLGTIAFILFLFFWGYEMSNNFNPLNQIFFAFYINFLFSGLTQYTFGDGECLFFIMACYTITQVINIKTPKIT